MRYCSEGIDPGKTGAIAFIQVVDGVETYEVFDFETTSLKQIRALMNAYNPNIVVLEQVHIQSGSASKGSTTFMKNVGIHIGIICEQYPLIEVLPAKWQKTLGITYTIEPGPVKVAKDASKEAKDLYKKEKARVAALNKKRRKEANMAFARKRFPKAELNLQKHQDRAEALSIALYGIKTNFNKNS